MSSKFASGKWAIAQCDRCSFRYKLKELKRLVIKTKNVNILVCPTCWEPDQPQLQLGMYPVNDPQALRNPRPDVSYLLSGNSGLQIGQTNATDVNNVGTPMMGSRDIQWGWNPVGGSRNFDAELTPNNLVLQVQLGTVTVVTT
jgi:hypothetical protein